MTTLYQPTSPNSTPLAVDQQKKLNLVEFAPLQLGGHVLQWSKVVMLRFIYQFWFKHIPQENLMMACTDTDSLKFGLCSAAPVDDPHNLLDFVPPERREAFLADYGRFMVEDHYDEAKNKWVADDLVKRYTPGLFAIEFHGKAVFAAATKMYAQVPWDETEDEYLKVKGVPLNQTPHLTADVLRETIVGDRVVQRRLQTFRVQPKT